MIVGVIRPTIYISDTYKLEELRAVFVHELYHYKNADTLWNVISTALLCLNWFNPIAWWSFKVFRRDLEMYCDYRAIQLIGEKKTYANVLLKTAIKNEGFRFATTCLENGQKEVSQRIKRIARFKKPKVWVSCIGLGILIILALLCLTNPTTQLANSSTIGIMGPNGTKNSYTIDIPKEWNKDITASKNSHTAQYEDIVLYNKDKTETLAGLTYVLINDDDSTLQAEEQNSATRIAEKIEGIASQSNTMKRLNDSVSSYLIAGKQDININNVFMVYQAQYYSGVKEGSKEDELDGLIDGKNLIRTELYLVLDEFPKYIPIIYTENPKVSKENLLGMISTIKKVEEPTEYIPIDKAGIYANHDTGVGIMGGEYDAKKLLKSYFNNYVAADFPIEKAIKSYKINSMEEIKPVGDIPNIIDSGMIEGETIPWNIIYPTARLYKIDYELVPKDKEKYKDVAGGGFEITSIGNKRYEESYGVFYSFSVDGREYEAAFLGFIHPSNLAEYGIDYSVMKKIDDWYDQVLWPRVLSNAKVKYVGNISAVGKLVSLLPLSEYTNGMELKTKQVPYGLTINYKIGRTEPYNAKQGGTLSAWPEKDGDLSGIYSKVNQGELNGYIVKKMNANASKIIDKGIDNASSIEIKLASPYLPKDYKTIYSDPYK